jgi:hypothetical protein
MDHRLLIPEGSRLLARNGDNEGATKESRLRGVCGPTKLACTLQEIDAHLKISTWSGCAVRQANLNGPQKGMQAYRIEGGRLADLAYAPTASNVKADGNFN